MPKVNHRRGGGGEGKHVSSFADVQARNEGKMSAYDRARAERRGEAVQEDEDEDKEQQQQQPRKPKGSGVQGLITTENPNAVKRNVETEGVELSRRQREEIEKQAARRRYEELHKAGKTDEAKADLARLEEVKKRREEAAKKRAEEEAAAKEAAEAKPKDMRRALNEELKDIIKGPVAEELDEEGGKKKKKEESSYADCVKVEEGKAPEKKKAMDGSISACRDAEDDFM